MPHGSCSPFKPPVVLCVPVVSRRGPRVCVHRQALAESLLGSPGSPPYTRGLGEPRMTMIFFRGASPPCLFTAPAMTDQSRHTFRRRPGRFPTGRIRTLFECSSSHSTHYCTNLWGGQPSTPAIFSSGVAACLDSLHFSQCRGYV